MPFIMRSRGPKISGEYLVAVGEQHAGSLGGFIVFVIFANGLINRALAGLCGHL